MTALLLALLLQVKPQPGMRTASAEATPSASISGRVVRSDNTPIRRARVRLSLVAGGAPQQASTDDDGRYSFTELAAGSYLVSTSKLGFVSTAFGQRRAFDRGEPIVVAEGVAIEKIDLIMPRAPTLAGIITDENGEPVQDSAVSVWQVHFTAGRRRLVGVPGASSRRTDDRGRYRLFGLPPGRYLVSAVVGQLLPDQSTLDIPGYARTYFPGTPNPTDAEFVELRAGQDVGNVDFSLVHGQMARISGHAYSSDGAPVQGLTLMPSFRSGAVTTDPVGARTHADGSFEFENVAPGEYVVQAARPRASQSSEGEFGARYVTLNGADVTDVIIQTSPGSDISGHVTFEDGDPPKTTAFEISPTPVDLDLTPAIGRSIASANAAEDWTFAMHGVNGPRRLKVIRTPDGWMMKRILHDGLDVTDAVQLFGTAQQSLANVEVVMTRAVTSIGGNVTDGHGAPAIDAAVVAFSADRGLWYAGSRFVARADVRRSGSCTISALPPGDYHVAVVDKARVPDVAGEMENPEFLESLIAGSTRVSLLEGGHPSLALKMTR